MIFLLVLLLLISLWFSVVEIALSSENAGIKPISEKRNREYHIATLGVYFSINIAFCTALGIFLRQNYYALSDMRLSIIGITATIVVMILSNKIIGKLIFVRNKKAVVKISRSSGYFAYVVFWPVVKIVNCLSLFILRLSGVKFRNDNGDIPVDLDKVAEHIIRSEHEKEMKIFRNALDFSDVKLKECMIPDKEIEMIADDADVDEIKKKFIDSGYSRIPIYGKSSENIEGYISAKDLFKGYESLKSLLRPIDFVPETMSARKQLTYFIRNGKSIAIVVDEFGSTVGLVTMEDIMEKIFGDIEDEHDSDNLIEKQLSENSYIFSGRLEVDYINEKYDLKIPESEDYETIAGYAIFKYEGIPVKDTEFEADNYTIKILRTETARIDLIKLVVNA